MIGLLYKLVSGKAWTTVRSATAEFGPPPGAVYRDELACFSDAELYAYGDAILVAARRRQRRRAGFPVA
ncbi:hypothetical protein [Couchioplanes caeruleus]|uniref:Uncharacterized protein n=1 Tax=Couchioplanes caeruleus TaxID=56438 RepID=A0A3N1GH53_9ACTN|nr:hypothetical protein [Couchioplanes caeruleus]ROP29528.1 hypothetical protein EDD30_2326 [Couchioplanes caeruleus]